MSESGLLNGDRPGRSSSLGAARASNSKDLLHRLRLDECNALLKSETVGRVVYTDNALPAVTPLNYVMDGTYVTFRTVRGSRLARAIDGAVVAFEVDSIDRETHSGWSVVVTGVASACDDPELVARLRSLPLVSWAGGVRDQFFRLPPGFVSGRRIGKQGG